MIRFDDNSNWQSWILERRADGAILVRVPSSLGNSLCDLPDAVFAFRDGDPQYGIWAERLAARESSTQ